MKCCEKCLRDELLKSTIVDRGEIHHCDFCGQFSHCVDATQLTDYFMPIFELYTIANSDDAIEESDYIWNLFQDDWQIFQIQDRMVVKKLVSEILQGADIEFSKYSKTESSMQGLRSWSEFKLELMHSNRFFPRKSEKIVRQIKGFLPFLIHDFRKDEIFYRSRVSDDGTVFDKTVMGKPPKSKTHSGRANPTGISYLYLGSSVKTAITETRPHVGHIVTVATHRLQKDIAVIDLRDPIKNNSFSPFAQSEEAVNTFFHFIEFLKKLGEELSTPVLPNHAQLSYIPTQYICELIKSAGYSGVIYSSSLAEGYNVAAFSDDVFIVEDCTPYMIEENIYRYHIC